MFTLKLSLAALALAVLSSSPAAILLAIESVLIAVILVFTVFALICSAITPAIIERNPSCVRVRSTHRPR